jgi:hypothetical protein
MTKQEIEKPVYTLNGDKFADIEQMTYGDYLCRYWSDETTSPRGVESKLHIREVERVSWLLPDGKTFDTFDGDTQEDVTNYVNDHNEEEEIGGDVWPDSEKLAEKYGLCFEVREWWPNGRARLVETFENEEDAEIYIFERWEYSHQTKSYNAPTCCNSMEEARAILEERRNLPREVNLPSVHPIIQDALRPFMPNF